MAKVNLSGLKILVIDDETFIRQMTVRILKDLEVREAYEASNGKEGLKIMNEVGKDLDIVICDLEMPEMDGFEFIKQLRALPIDFNPEIPVLIMSGHSEEEAVRNAIGAGINGYLVKPISKKALENKIKASVGNPMTDTTKTKT